MANFIGLIIGVILIYFGMKLIVSIIHTKKDERSKLIGVYIFAVILVMFGLYIVSDAVMMQQCLENTHSLKTLH